MFSEPQFVRLFGRLESFIIFRETMRGNKQVIQGTNKSRRTHV